MKVTVLGHASLLFAMGDERILLDPILRTTSLMGSVVHQYPRELDLAAMPRPTLLVITHEHYDHYDPRSLALLPTDIPVVLPADQRLAEAMRSLGFHRVHTLESWESFRHGQLTLTATPSEADVTELGLLVETEDGRLWHMSDAEPPADTSARILAEHGTVDVVSVKYQPPDPLLNFLHNEGSSFDCQTTARWLEHACAVGPTLAFPYASGLCLTEDRSWLNRYAYPFSSEYVAGLLEERLAGTGRSAVVGPGDVISIEDGEVSVLEQASMFVRQSAPETSIDWEPLEIGTLRVLDRDDERQSLVAGLTEVVEGEEFASWVAAHPKLFGAFWQWRVLCQFVVHLGGGEERS